MRYCILLFLSFGYITNAISQSHSNIWQLGYSSPKGYLDFSFGAPFVDSIIRPMNFRSTEAIMCDNNGQLLFYTNGMYIANANHDTMQNGSGLNPGPFTQMYSPGGLPIFQAALALPYPGESDKYILIHETGDINFIYPQLLYQSIIDMTLDGGLGGVILKNDTILLRPIEFGELTACKHANGRDWWVLAHRHLTNWFYKLLITPQGISIDSQLVSGPISDYGGQAAFSPDGNWYATFDNLSKLRLYNFDRCSGMLNNFQYFDFVPDTLISAGLSFSPNSKVLYASSVIEIFQFDLSATNIGASQKTVAIYDGYYSPNPPFATDFLWHMLGPDGKIYISSGSSVFDLHVINYPDNLDTLCDVSQHSLHLGFWNNKTLPNHINYWLGADSTSVCDSLVTLYDLEYSDLKLSVLNPVLNPDLELFYELLPGNDGKIEMFDIEGRKIIDYRLPHWSTQQTIKLSNHILPGVYIVQLTSGAFKQSRKIIIQ